MKEFQQAAPLILCSNFMLCAVCFIWSFFLLLSRNRIFYGKILCYIICMCACVFQSPSKETRSRQRQGNSGGLLRKVSLLFAEVRIQLPKKTFFDCLNEFEWRNNIYFRVGIFPNTNLPNSY